VQTFPDNFPPSPSEQPQSVKDRETRITRHLLRESVLSAADGDEFISDEAQPATVASKEGELFDFELEVSAAELVTDRSLL